MCPFNVGDFVKHKGNCGPEAMLVCAVREKGDRWRGEEFSIGCRWWDTERKRFQIEWFAVEELEGWKD